MILSAHFAALQPDSCGKQESKQIAYIFFLSVGSQGIVARRSRKCSIAPFEYSAGAGSGWGGGGHP